MSANNLGVDFCGVRFLNPFILAAAPSTDSRDMIARGFEAGWAGAVIKTTSLESEEVSIVYPIMEGLEPGKDMLGMLNIDLLSERHIHEILPDIAWLKQRFPDQRVIMSVMGNSRDDWHELVRLSEEAGADLVEASISCPQGATLEGVDKADGWMISQDARLTEIVTGWAVEVARQIPIYVKIGPNVTDIAAIARAIERAGGAGICAIDSPEAILGVNPVSLSPLPSVQGYGSRGGFTGRAIKPIGLRCVADIAGAVRIPISGVGGIYDWRDALDYLLLGATTLQVCTAVMQYGFAIVDDLSDGLSRWMERNRFVSLADLIGLSLPYLKEHDELPHGVKVISAVKRDVCIGCGLCYVACRDGGHVAIGFESDRQPVVDADACVGCGLCAQICPVPECISIVNHSP